MRVHIPAGRNGIDRARASGFARGFAACQKAAIAIARPTPHVEEERECAEVAEAIRNLRPWPEHPEFGAFDDV